MRESTAIQIMQIIAGLGCMGLGVAGIVLVGRGRGDADEHDVADYRPARPVPVRLVADVAPYVAAARRNWPLVDADSRPAGARRLRPGAVEVLPPAVSGPARASLYSALVAERVVAEVLRARYGTTSSEVIASGMLREIADDERAKDGIGPDGHAWQLDGSCWADCPGCAYDMTGAFPVVRAA